MAHENLLLHRLRASLKSAAMLKRYFTPMLGLGLLLATLACAEDKKKEATAPAKSAEPSAAEMLKDPSKATLKAPETFKAKFATTAGDFTVEVTRKWAPLGADRFYNLVKAGYYTDVAFFRVIDGFMAQFGLHGDPAVGALWRTARIKDDPVGKVSNLRGTLTFATAGANTRTTQLFINFGNNANLDITATSPKTGFAPFAKVIDDGMKVVDKIYKIGEGAPRGRGPSQGTIQAQGNKYLKEKFPNLTYITNVTLVK